jgi:hypothetical protein
MVMANYTVQSGDTLSKIYKSLGYGSWQDLWNSWKSSSRSGNANMIYIGEQIPYKAAATTNTAAPAPVTIPAPTVTATPSETLGNTVAGNLSTKEQFAKRFGTLAELTPEAAFTQFGEQQVSPTYYRQASQALRDAMKTASASGAYRVGQTNTEMTNTVNDIESQRKAAVAQYVQAQKDPYTDWYNAEMESYMNAPDPGSYTLNNFDLSGYGVDNSAYNNQFKYKYNPVNLTNMFGGYGSAFTKPGKLYGDLTQTTDPLLATDRTNIRY